MLWSGPFQILVVLGLLVRVIHVWPAVAGLAVTIALIPMTTLVGRKLSTVRKRLMGYTDARVKLCTEVVTGERELGSGVCVDTAFDKGEGGARVPFA